MARAEPRPFPGSRVRRYSLSYRLTLRDDKMQPMSPSDVTNKLWNYCHVLRDDGMSYGDYVEQLTYLLFLKMADERTQAPYNQPSIVPQQYSWSSLIKKDSDESFDQFSGSRCPALTRKPGPRLLPWAFGGIEVHRTSISFRLTHHALDALGKAKGLLGLIFNKAQNKFQDPAKLRRLLVDLIDKENWSVMSADVKGDAYEGLLEKNAQDTKSGAGQYFTPRALIDSAHPWSSAFGRAARAQFRSRRNCQAMLDVMAPEPGETIADPACGTGGFLLAAHQYLVDNYPNMTKPQKKALKSETFKGWELVQSTARLCAMNLLLHGIGDQEYEPIVVSDSLAADPGERFDLILANPPFGKKSGTTIVGEGGKVSKERDTVERDDFWATTSNKQLNFVQHIKTLLKVNGSAAVVVPDNVLFEGGAGETIRRRLLHEIAGDLNGDAGESWARCARRFSRPPLLRGGAVMAEHRGNFRRRPRPIGRRETRLGTNA